MIVTATEFRKDLFRMVESALDGENVDVLYKGRALRLVPEKTPLHKTRLELLQATPLPAVSVSDTLLDDMNEMSKALESDWEAKWTKRLK